MRVGYTKNRQLLSIDLPLSLHRVFLKRMKLFNILVQKNLVLSLTLMEFRKTKVNLTYLVFLSAFLRPQTDQKKYSFFH